MNRNVREGSRKRRRLLPGTAFAATLVAAAALSAPQTAWAQCPGGMSGPSGGSIGETAGGGGLSGGSSGMSSAMSAVSAVQSAQALMQMQQQRNEQYRQMLQQRREYYLAAHRARANRETSSSRVSEDTIQARREARRQRREERIARNLERLNRIREEIEAKKALELDGDSADTRVATIGSRYPMSEVRANSAALAGAAPHSGAARGTHNVISHVAH